MDRDTSLGQTLKVGSDDGAEGPSQEDSPSVFGGFPDSARGGAAQGTRAKFARYEVVEEIGRGAMGVVFKAWDPKLDRWVALKTVQLAASLHSGERTEFLRRFAHEAKAAGRLSHPHIVMIYDVGEEANIPFIAMEYVQGRPLDSLLQAGSRPVWQEALEVVAQIAAGLEHAHERGIVHRDVKPANILLTPEGQAKITDFGIAKIPTSTLTQGRHLLGTPSYMSPEQVQGGPLDQRSDIFSLGIILYDLLTGQKPFRGDDLAAICYQVVHHDPRPLREIRPDLPPGLDQIVGKAMAKDPGQRYQRVGELREDLRRMLRGVAPRLSTPGGEPTVLTGSPGLGPVGPAMETWEALGAMGRGLADRALEIWRRRGTLSRRQAAFLSLGAGLLLLGLLLVLLQWTDPLNRAKRELKAGRSEAAIAELLKVKARTPDAAEVQYLLGEAYLQAGRSGPAVKAYRQAVELEPAYARDPALFRRLVGLLGGGEIAGEVSALMIHAGAPAVPALEEALDNRRHRLRWNAVRTLEQMGIRPDYVRPYILDLKSEDCVARKRAAERLGELGDRRAVPALVEAKKRPLLDNYCMLGALDRALGRLGAR